MNRITECLSRLKSENKKAFVAYIVNGDPRIETTLDAMHELVASGVDIIELGVPFSDPMAEGPVIQKGHERALANNASLTSSMEVVAQFRETNADTPIVLMGYANPIERMGYETFAKTAVDSGVDGLLTVDLPPEENEHANKLLNEAGIKTISLIAPTTTDERIQKIADQSSGFLYYVSLKGVTGAGHLDTASVEEKVNFIKSVTDLPVLVGFGIKDAQTAKMIGAVADGVIVGSVLVNVMAENQAETDEAIHSKLVEVTKPIRQALDELN